MSLSCTGGDQDVNSDKYKPHENSPNPFNLRTILRFPLFMKGRVTITVYDVLIIEVETILERNMDAGYHKAEWNASDVPSGIYFVRMQSGDFKQVRKCMVVR